MTDPEHMPRLDEGSDELMGALLRAARREVPDQKRMDALALALADKLPLPPPDGSDGGDSGDGGADGGGSGADIGAQPSGGESMPPGADAVGVAEIAGKVGATGGAAPATIAGVGGGSFAAKAGIATLAALVIAGGVWTATQSTPAPSQQPVTAATMTPTAVEPKQTQATEPAPVVSIDDLPQLPVAPSAEKPAQRAAPHVAPSTAPVVAPEPARSSADAMADLRKAQDALGANPARSLQLIAEHRANYPRSAFSQERDVLEIDALLRLGRRSEAVARGDQFARYYPKSAHLRRIDALLGR